MKRRKTSKIGPKGSKKRHDFFARIGRKGGKAGKGKPKRKKGILRKLIGGKR